MKKMYRNSMRMLMSLVAVIAFMFVGLTVQAQDSNADDLNALKAKKQQIEATFEGVDLANASESPKATYYLDLVAYYDLVITDVEENGKTMIDASMDNIGEMPVLANGERNMRDFPKITGLALKKN